MTHTIIEYHDCNDGAGQGERNVDEKPGVATAVKLGRFEHFRRDGGFEEGTGNDHVEDTDGSRNGQGPGGVDESDGAYDDVGRDQAPSDEHGNDIEEIHEFFPEKIIP